MIRSTTTGTLKTYRYNLQRSSYTMNKARETVQTQRQFNSFAEDPAAAAAIGALRERAFSSLAHPWTAEEMAAAVNLSPSRFFALYKTLWGTSPIADLIRARIDAARTRLAGTDVPVARIAEELGYANLTHFSRQFRAMTGISPAAFRRAGRG